jgi:transcriptional regulator with XRE-family HTH domain
MNALDETIHGGVAAPDERALGAAIRKARQEHGLSVREMARKLECSPGHVSQIERGLSSPSVAMLFRILSVLHLSLDDLVHNSASVDSVSTEGETSEPDVIVRGGHHRQITLAGGITWQMLTPAVEPGFEFTMYRYEVGASDGQDFMRHTGSEYGLVLSGRMGCGVGFDEYILEVGDSIALDSATPHRFWNAGDVPAQMVWIVRSCPSDAPDSEQGAGPGE